MLTENIRIIIEEALNDKVVDSHSVSGGCINDSKIIVTKSDKNFFLKSNVKNPTDMFLKEANGLRELRKPNVIRVPEVIYSDNELILLETIEPGKRRNDFFEDFGRKLAQLHKYNSNDYGFYENNYIGSTPQINVALPEEKNNWNEFYFNERLMFQFKLAEKNGYSTDELRKSFGKLEEKIESIVKPEKEISSLLHGDLWGGNYILDETGSACLIDPAVYYGNREADLAMTKLFGGFEYKFYAAYNEEYPSDTGYEY
ncbi:MAG: fructosamine kinase family protein, partial [Ignavibacteriaceae bacterium]